MKFTSKPYSLYSGHTNTKFIRKNYELIKMTKGLFLTANYIIVAC